MPALHVPVAVSQQPVQVLVGHCPPQPSDWYWHLFVQVGVQQTARRQNAGDVQVEQGTPAAPQYWLVVPD